MGACLPFDGDRVRGKAFCGSSGEAFECEPQKLCSYRFPCRPCPRIVSCRGLRSKALGLAVRTM